MTLVVNCPNCGMAVPEEELIRFGEAQVCVHCKESFSQRLREGSVFGEVAQNTSEGYVVQSLHYGSTWKLFGLAVITLGIYSGHYILKKTRELNEFLDHDQKISPKFAWAILIMGYVGIAQIIPYTVALYFYPEWEQSMDAIAL